MQARACAHGWGQRVNGSPVRVASVGGKVGGPRQGKLVTAGPRWVKGGDEGFTQQLPAYAVLRWNPPLIACNCGDLSLRIYMRIVVAYMADSPRVRSRRQRLLVTPPGEISPSKDVEDKLDSLLVATGPLVLTAVKENGCTFRDPRGDVPPVQAIVEEFRDAWTPIAVLEKQLQRFKGNAICARSLMSFPFSHRDAHF
ncbi:hypothetical protein AK812_SmicGene28380 [Symbiodinium microadriaticum]|uniref:Uncharacterized protein n=1 Tax=Symbiodinium microadriaticum TaxID=2951 RepID=A0A1Q9D4H0_SYMMI|nr:hypothetical protein AK812_SmicGene28380 [Symbiodinium microadriaticum]